MTKIMKPYISIDGVGSNKKGDTNLPGEKYGLEANYEVSNPENWVFL